MKRVNRIHINLLDEELKDLINTSTKIFPITQEDVDNNYNPEGYEYGRVGNHIYRWTGTAWEYIIADDADITWEDVKGKPTMFKPIAHNHTEEEITNLDKYTKEETNNLLADKSPSNHNHDTKYAGLNHNHDTKYAGKSIEVTVEDIDERLFNIENGYTEGHSHPNVDLLNSITEGQVANWDTVTNKANKDYVDTELGKKANKSTTDGHINNATIHVSQNDKDKWNAKSKVSIGTTKPTDGSLWYKII